MSIHVMSRVWQDAKVDGSALLVLLAMADYADDEGVCYPSTASLAKKSRLSKRSVQYVTKALEENGVLIIEKQAGPRGTNRYIINLKTLHKTVDMSSANGWGVQGGANPAPPQTVHPRTPQPRAPEPSTTVRTPLKGGDDDGCDSVRDSASALAGVPASAESPHDDQGGEEESKPENREPEASAKPSYFSELEWYQLQCKHDVVIRTGAISHVAGNVHVLCADCKREILIPTHEAQLKEKAPQVKEDADQRRARLREQAALLEAAPDTSA